MTKRWCITIPHARSFQPGPASGPLSPGLRGLLQRRVVRSRPFCHQQGSDNRAHHQHPQAHPRSGLQEASPRALREIQEHARKETGTPDVHIDPRLNHAAWAKGRRNVPYPSQALLSRKHNEEEDSPDRLYMWVTYVPVTTFKNLQS